MDIMSGSHGESSRAANGNYANEHHSDQAGDLSVETLIIGAGPVSLSCDISPGHSLL